MQNRVHKLAVLPVFAGISRFGRLWIALVGARCEEFPSETQPRLTDMNNGVSSIDRGTQHRVAAFEDCCRRDEREVKHGVVAGVNGGVAGTARSVGPPAGSGGAPNLMRRPGARGRAAR